MPTMVQSSCRQNGKRMAAMSVKATAEKSDLDGDVGDGFTLTSIAGTKMINSHSFAGHGKDTPSVPGRDARDQHGERPLADTQQRQYCGR